MSAAAVDRRVLLACELALVAVTGSVVLGFARLFQNGTFLPKVAFMGLASHLLAAGMRRLHRGIVVSALVSLIGLATAVGLLLYADTTTAGLPTFATRDAARADLADAWKLFGDVRAPAPVHPGFVLAAGLAIWAVAFLADWAAFRLWSPAEAVAPAGIVFLFSSLQSAKDYQLASTAGFAGTVLVFVLLHRLARHDTGASWLATEPARGRSSVMRVGTVVGAAAIITGLVVGPALPGAGEEAMVPWRDIGDGNGNGSRITLSPLVTIKSRLVDLSATEAFTVKSDRPDYWRLTALDKFDGVAWTSSGQYESARDELPSELPAGTVTEPLVQQITIKALSTLWLPAAYEPQAVLDDGGTKPSYEPESGTLTVGNNQKTADGKTYTVVSRVPARDANAIMNASSAVPAEVAARYTALPANFSRRVRDLAMSLTRTKPTPYEKAKALQDFLRGPNFTYDLNASNGHGTDAITQFLFVTKAGYCEQFAGSYAAMARAIGLPTRVAVGFTPGERDADGEYHVRGEHAHAWPEVYFAGIGWVRFEPTPGRGAPGDESYTGVAPQQASGGDPTASAPVTTPTTPPSTETTPADPSTAADAALAEAEAGLTTSSGALTGPSRSPVTGFLRLLAAFAAAAVVLVASVPLTKAVRRSRRRARLHATRRGRVDSAWADTIDALALLDVPVDAAATPQELAARAAPTLGAHTAPALFGLAELTTQARYALDDPDDRALVAAARSARSIRAAVVKRVSWRRRVARQLDPRSLLAGEPSP